ncbi:MAG: peptidylprolyl isomerase [Alphaproteobacteria bacterium]|nr:peptidylprolyl isomerase [Alphaproteobacteria bacterium]
MGAAYRHPAARRGRSRRRRVSGLQASHGAGHDGLPAVPVQPPGACVERAGLVRVPQLPGGAGARQRPRGAAAVSAAATNVGVTSAGRVAVNGVEIAERAIHAEMQNHPAGNPEAAMRAAAEALVVRELLLQESRRLGHDAPTDGDQAPDEAAISRLIEEQVETPTADEATCRRYYENNRRRFMSPAGFEALHILCAAPPDDAEARAAARARAEAALARVLADPACFADVARETSDCPSKAQGGQLGLVQRGDADPVFETYLMSLGEDETCPTAVETRYGFHVIRLARRAPARDLPFEAVKERIAAYIEETAWRRAVHQYVAILAGRASIEGVELQAATSPLVQ